MPVLVEKCVPGVVYLVDCEDGHDPCRMTFLGQVGKSFQFRGESGDKAVFQAGESVEDAPAPPPIDDRQLGLFVEEASKDKLEQAEQTETEASKDKPEQSDVQDSVPPVNNDQPAVNETAAPATKKRGRPRKNASKETVAPGSVDPTSPPAPVACDFITTLAREIAADLLEDRAQHTKDVADIAANPKATAPQDGTDFDKVAAMLDANDTDGSTTDSTTDSTTAASEDKSIYMLTYDDLQVIAGLFRGRCRVPVRALSDDTLVLLDTMDLLDEDERKFVRRRLSNLITGKTSSSSAREDLHITFKPDTTPSSETP